MPRKDAPSYSLKKIKSVFNSPYNLNMTYSASQGAAALNFNDQDVVDAIQALTTKDFYKSMPPVSINFTAWQDVYKSTFRGIKLYIKFQINDDGEAVVSFKEQ